MMFIRVLKREDKSYVFVFDEEKLLMIKVYFEDEFPVGSIVHGRIKKIDNKSRLTFVDIGKRKDAFCEEKLKLKSGDDAFFNIRKTPDDEKFYTLDTFLHLNSKNALLRADFYDLNKVCLAGDESDYDELKTKWEEIIKLKNTLPIPKLIFKNDFYHDLSLKYDLEESQNDVILKKLLQNSMPNFERRIDFKKGYIYLDILPYVSIFDVNSGDYNEYFDSIKNRLEVNKYALKKIVEVLLLRNIEGVILVDILNLPGKMNKDFLLYLKNEYKHIHFHDITKLGILEMTIKKTGGLTVTKEVIQEILNNL